MAAWPEHRLGRAAWLALETAYNQPTNCLQPEPRALFFHDLANQVNLSDGVRLGAIPEHQSMA